MIKTHNKIKNIITELPERLHLNDGDLILIHNRKSYLSSWQQSELINYSEDTIFEVCASDVRRFRVKVQDTDIILKEIYIQRSSRDTSDYYFRHNYALITDIINEVEELRIKDIV